MSDVHSLEFGTNIQGNQLIAGNNRLAQFHIIIKNNGSKEMPRINITLNTPPEVKVVARNKSIGYIPRGKTRNSLFKVKSRIDGIYNLEAIVTRKNSTIGKVPITFFVGQASISQAPAQIPSQQPISPVIKEKPAKVAKTEKCRYCNTEIEGPAKFCPSCGADLTKIEKEIEPEIKVCPSCGGSNPSEARFCAECGSEIK